MLRRHYLSYGAALCAAAFAPTARAQAPALNFPGVPSQMLDADVREWIPFLAALQLQIATELAAPEGVPQATFRSHQIALALIAQVRGAWNLVRAPIERARRAQDTESGRLTAGLVNELLAEQQVMKRDGHWLANQVSRRFGALPWSVTEAAVRALHEQLQSATPEGVRNYVKNRLDLSVAFAKGSVSLGLGVQLVGLRVNVQQILPQREHLVAGLQRVLAMHPKT